MIELMLSLRAKLTKRLLRVAANKAAYDMSHIDRHRRRFDRNLALMFPGNARLVRRQKNARVPVGVIEPSSAASRTIVYLHGGGFILGSTKSHRQHLKRLAGLCEARVFAIDYSLSPESSYPTALNEIEDVWTELIASNLVDPKHTVFMGDSAGGNLALASLLRFRDRNGPLPSCIVLLSPGLDATLSGESHLRLDGIDPLLSRAKLELFVNSYVGKSSKHDPNISPIFADLHRLPPMLVHVGTDEMLLSDARTITDHATRDGVDATLFVGQGLWHGWHFFAPYLPEAKQAMKLIANFVRQHS